MDNTISRGQLLIISAPSGAGKTSLIRALVENDRRIEVSVFAHDAATAPWRDRRR